MADFLPPCTITSTYQHVTMDAKSEQYNAIYSQKNGKTKKYRNYLSYAWMRDKLFLPRDVLQTQIYP